MKIETCPRCGVKRPDDLRWCRKCGLDLALAERGVFPRDMGTSPTIRRPPGGWAVDQVPPPAESESRQPYIPQVDVRPVNDRQSMARWTASALDVRCGAMTGGCLGMFLGFMAAGMVGAAIGGVAPLLLLPFGIFIGLFIGMRLALSLMAR
ncbi:MAG: hypothetical protein ACYC65_01785 [Candidatus Limnocylindrales bacterium]